MIGPVDDAPTLAIAPAPEPHPAAPYERAELLHQIFAATATLYPLSVAARVADPNPEIARRSFLTYGDLRARAAQFARYLRARGVSRGDKVVICLPRGVDALMAVLGVLEAAACYVPVDWSNPQDRIDGIIADCDARAVVTFAERAPAFGADRLVIALDLELGDIAAADPTPLAPAETGADPDDLAYVIYTSGSTGKPKGVAIRQRNICHLVRAEGAVLGVEARDKVYGGFSLAFDMSVETMWSAFLVGAELIVGSEALAVAGPALAGTLIERGVTVWHVVPSLLGLIETDVPSVRLLNLGGEACPPALVRRWWRPDRRLLNTYGPTETTVTATWAELHPDQPVTIGRPLPGYAAWIVDEHLWPVAPGQPGELIIGGPGVGAGYLNRPDLTADKFTLTPFAGPSGTFEPIYRTGDLCRQDETGAILFLGRIDTQIKIRGFRVELGEIEALLGEDDAVAQAAVAYFPEETGGADGILVAYLAIHPGQSLDLDRLKAAARARLPAYMRPDAYERLPSLPMLVSGKIDRKALPRPVDVVIDARDVEGPSGAVETRLHAIWARIFAPQPVSVLDDFFDDLGGHSLRAARMISLAREDADFATLSIQDLYAKRTIRALARHVADTRGAAAARVEPFAPVPAWRHAACGLAQALALVPIFVFAGLQWVSPYLVYLYLTDDYGQLTALLYAGLAFMAARPTMIVIAILAKWLVLGRTRAGDHPLWGLYYFRWWFVRRLLAVVQVDFLAGTPFMALYYRALGARIGRDVFLGLAEIDAPDLVTIGDDAVIEEGAILSTTSAERGLLRIGPLTIGARASVGVMAVVGRGAEIGDDAALEDMSSLSAGHRIPAGQVFGGSPASAKGARVPPAPPAPVEPLRRALVVLGLLVASLVLPVAAVLPVAPGLIALIEIDWTQLGFSYAALAPGLALVYVIGMCVLNIAAKWLLLGRVRPGRHSIWSGFYVRYWIVRQLGRMALDLLHPIYATLYVGPWYRAMGAKVGPRAEISTATAIMHDLVEIGPESFIADGVVFGAARHEPGTMRLDRTRIGRRAFIGNSALLPAGSQTADDVLVGVLSKLPDDPKAAAEPGATWFGSPAIRLPTRQIDVVFDEGARFKPSARLVAARLAVEYVRITLSLSVFIAMFSVMINVIEDLLDGAEGLRDLALAFPFLYLGFAVSGGLVVIALKWLVIGRYEPRTAPLWSGFVWRTELVTATYEALAVPNLLEPLRGTPFINFYLRLMGCAIGRRVFTDTTDITEFDLVRVGDDAALNEAAGLQTHLFEDRVMKLGRVEIGPRATVGSLAIVLYDGKVGADAQLGDLSVLMKGETLPDDTAWEGSPAQPARA